MTLNSAAFGQHYFNKTVDVIGLGGGEVFRGVNYNPIDGSIYLLGTSEFVGLNNPILVKFDTFGNFIESNFISNSSTGETYIPGFNNFILTTNSSFQVFCGAMRYDEAASAIAFKIDENYDTVWTREFYEPEEYLLFSGAIEDQNGDYVFTGYNSTYDAVRQAWLVKMDPDGNLLWQQNYGGFGGEFTYSVDNTLDGGYILAGFTDTYGAGERDIYVVKTDELGNVEWEKWFGSPGNDIGYAKELSNGHFIIYGGFNFIHPVFDWVDANHGYAAELDENGNMIWSKIFATPDSASFTYYTLHEEFIDCEIVEDGIIFCGGSVDSVLMDPLGWVVKIDFQGNILWDRKYQLRTNDHYLWDMTELPGGDLLFGGFVFPTGGGVDSQDGWIMRTNCLGFNGPPILEATLNHDTETHTATVYNNSQRFGDGEIDWGDGTVTLFTEHDTTVFTHVYTQNGEYDIQFKINACYHHDSLVFHQSVSGIPDPEPPLSEFAIYPNPTNGQLTLSYNPTGEILDAGVQIFDISGRLVFNKDLPLFYNSTVLELEHLSTGTYVLRFFTVGGDEVVERLVVH